jgi:hypothetical protein
MWYKTVKCYIKVFKKYNTVSQNVTSSKIRILLYISMGEAVLQVEEHVRDLDLGSR